MFELDIDRVSRLLKAKGCPADSRLFWFDRIGSTNDHIMGLRDYHGTVCVAGEQTAGRGRRGRVWESAPGAGLYLSMGWDMKGTNPVGLSLLCGLTLLESLQESGVAGLALKWPNDVLLDGDKLAGVLVELNGSRCIIGIGLNVTLPYCSGDSSIASRENALPRTSLAAHGYTLDAESFTATLIHLLYRDLSMFCRTGFAAFVERWNAAHAYQGKTVQITGAAVAAGEVVGVDDRGGLCLQVNGEKQIFHVGDVSMKPDALSSMP